MYKEEQVVHRALFRDGQLKAGQEEGGAWVPMYCLDSPAEPCRLAFASHHAAPAPPRWQRGRSHGALLLWREGATDSPWSRSSTVRPIPALTGGLAGSFISPEGKCPPSGVSPQVWSWTLGSIFLCLLQCLFITRAVGKITKCHQLRRRFQGVFAWKESQQPDPQAKPENAPPSNWGQED